MKTTRTAIDVILCLVFESLIPGSGAATVAYLLPRPPTLCAVEGVTLKYSLSYILVDFSSSFSRDAMFQVIKTSYVHHFISTVPPAQYLEVPRKRQMILFIPLGI